MISDAKSKPLECTYIYDDLKMDLNHLKRLDRKVVATFGGKPEFLDPHSQTAETIRKLCALVAPFHGLPRLPKSRKSRSFEVFYNEQLAQAFMIDDIFSSIQLADLDVLRGTFSDAKRTELKSGMNNHFDELKELILSERGKRLIEMWIGNAILAIDQLGKQVA